MANSLFIKDAFFSLLPFGLSGGLGTIVQWKRTSYMHRIEATETVASHGFQLSVVRMHRDGVGGGEAVG